MVKYEPMPNPIRLARRILAGDVFAVVLAASLAGFLTVGLTGSPLEDPRLLLLFLLLVLTSIHIAGPRREGVVALAKPNYPAFWD